MSLFAFTSWIYELYQCEANGIFYFLIANIQRFLLLMIFFAFFIIVMLTVSFPYAMTYSTSALCHYAVLFCSTY